MKKYYQWLKRPLKKFKRDMPDPLPQISHPYNQALKKQQRGLLITLLIMIGMASFYSYFYVQNQIEAAQKIAVIVSANDLASPHEIVLEDLSEVYLPKSLLPEGFFPIADKADLIGQNLTTPLKAKQLLLQHYLHADMNPKSISAKFDQAFALSMDEDWFVAKLPNLKKNDRIDLLVTNPRDGLEATTILARSLKVISVSTGKSKRSLVVNATEEEAKSILFAKGLKLPMQVLVHSALNSPQ